MKKIYLFIFLLVSGFGFAQLELRGNAHYFLEITADMGRGKDGCGNIDGLREISVKYQNSPTLVDLFKGRLLNSAVYDSISYKEDNKITDITIHKIIRWENWAGTCNGGPEDRYVYVPVTPQFTYSLANAGDGLTNLAASSTPIINISNPDTNNDIIGTRSFLIIPEITGVKNEYFNWMYHIEGEGYYMSRPLGGRVWVDTWRSLPSEYQGKNSLNIKCEDFLSSTAIGKKIKIRANVKGDNVELRYQESAPIIVSTDQKRVSCYDTGSTDGKLKIYFDRAVFPGETFSITYSGANSGAIYDIKELDADNSYLITGLNRGDSQISMSGFYNGASTYSSYTELGGGVPYPFKIDAPPLLDFTLSNSTNVNCNAGQDGTITISPTGGTRDVVGNDYYSLDEGTTWVSFSNQASHTITNLAPNTYKIIVKDMNGCIASVQKIVDGKIELGETKVLSKTIIEPAAPVSLSYSSIQEPTFHGGSNGKVFASITGGTPISGNSYQYEWRNSNNEVIDNSKTTTEFASGVYAITLHEVPADIYTLQVRDANYIATTDNLGCTITPNISIELTQPDPIVVTFEVQRTISCNVSNEFGDETDQSPVDGQRDESQDGILAAHVTGGVPFRGFENNGLPYKYFWKKQIANGNWIPLSDEVATAENLSDGNYALNVEDANGIRLGTYVNNILTQEIDVTQFMAEPPKLELSFTKEDIVCSQGNNGWATANVTGGTPPYTYEWSNDETTQTITELTTNNYFVKITDAKGCSIQGSILIQQPNGVETNETITKPTCFEGNDGAITLAPTGGVTPYEYLWNTGETTQNLTNLAAGTYILTLTDANGCITIKTFELKNPDPIVIDLGKDRTLCNDQVLNLDASIEDQNTQYSWTSTNGFTSSEPKVSLTQAGIYHVKVTSSLGCIGEDEIEVKTNQAVIDSEYLLSSQAYLDEEVILVNISKPFGESTQWIIPNDVTVVDEQDKYVTVKFKETGVYTIGLQQTQGECFAVYNKNITVEKRSTLPNAGSTPKFVIDFIVTPNPSDGNFQAIINLENTSAVNLRLFSAAGQFTAINKKDSGKKNYQVDFNTNLPAGIYILVLETEQQTLVKKIIIY